MPTTRTFRWSWWLLAFAVSLLLTLIPIVITAINFGSMGGEIEAYDPTPAELATWQTGEMAYRIATAGAFLTVGLGIVAAVRQPSKRVLWGAWFVGGALLIMLAAAIFAWESTPQV